MGIESRDSFTITANLGEFPTGSVHGGNEICPDQRFRLPELSLHLQILGIFFCEKLGEISGTPHLCQRQVMVRNQLVDDCMLEIGWEIWLSVHPILELGEIRVS